MPVNRKPVLRVSDQRRAPLWRYGMVIVSLKRVGDGMVVVRLENPLPQVKRLDKRAQGTHVSHPRGAYGAGGPEGHRSSCNRNFQTKYRSAHSTFIPKPQKGGSPPGLHHYPQNSATWFYPPPMVQLGSTVVQPWKNDEAGTTRSLRNLLKSRCFYSFD